MNEQIADFSATDLTMFSGGQFTLRSKYAITVLFGKNGSGKSSFMRRFFDLHREEGVHYVSPERGGQLQYQAAIAETEMDPKRKGQSRVGNNFNPSYRQESIARISTLINHLGTRGPGDISLDVFWHQFNDLVSDVLPNIKFSTIPTPPFYELLRTDTNLKIAAGENVLSTGETEAVSVALDVSATAWMWHLKPETFQIILVDEIDAHFHPDLQIRFARFLAKISADFGCRFIIATHNPGMVSALSAYVDDLGIAFMTITESETTARSVSSENKNLMSLLGGHALAGPLLGAPMLIVEGDDDYDIWSQVARRSANGLMVSVVPAGGAPEVKKLQKSLEIIYGSLRDEAKEPAAFALLDGDQNVSGVPQDHVKFLYLSCEESENLYITDEVLADIGTDWSAASELIRNKATKFGDKAGALTAASGFERKSGDFKGVIKQIQQIIDPKNVSWPLRVAQTLGKSRPTGMIADFLGADVIKALWDPVSGPD